MDTAVALVQAYLNVNGYFTVVEYPVLEADRGAPARAVTDVIGTARSAVAHLNRILRSAALPSVRT